MPIDPRDVERLRHRKRQEVDRLLLHKLFPKASKAVFKYLGYETADNAWFKASYRQIHNHTKELPPSKSTPEASVVNKDTKPLVIALYDFLDDVAYSERDEKNAFRIVCPRDGHRGGGARLKFVQVRSPRRRQTLQTPMGSDEQVLQFWRKMIGQSGMQSSLVVYDTPDVERVGTKKENPKDARQRPGLWSGSGDVAAAFYVASVLPKLGLQFEILRWRDTHTEDLDRKYQCLLMIGNSVDENMLELREREEWEDRRSFQVIRGAGKGVLAEIADTRATAEGVGDKIHKHLSGKPGELDEDHALILLYRDSFHDQILFGIYGTTSAATRAAAMFLSQAKGVVKLECFLAEKGIVITPSSRGFEALLHVTLKNGVHERVSVFDAVAYRP